MAKAVCFLLHVLRLGWSVTLPTMLLILAGKGGEGPEEQARFLGQQLLRRQLARRVDRQIKKPLPGGCILA